MKGTELMRKIILCIHGRSNKPEETTLLEWWRSSIDEGLLKNCSVGLGDIEVDMAYYADIYNDKPVADANNKEPYKPAEPCTLVEYKKKIIDRLRGVAGDWLDDPLDWLDEHGGILSHFARGILKKTLKDLAEYYNETETREKVQARLLSKLDKYHNREIILVSHSKGTIVAYDVLRAMGKDPEYYGMDVGHFITLGSPLGLTVVQGQTSSEKGGKLRTPSVVTKGWHNFSDPGDFVAIDSHLRDDYEANSSNVRVEDELVANDYPGNAHKSYGYLRTPEFSRLIKSLI